MLDGLVSVIETLQKRIQEHGDFLRNEGGQREARTRTTLINPLLQALGWDPADPGLVTLEYRAGVGWADYVLKGPGNRPAAVVEAKRLGTFVENHLDQAVGYCIQQGIAYAGVTDGNHWQLYRTFDQRPLAEKIILDVRIDNTPAHECALQLLLLWRPNLELGRPVAANKPILAPMPAPPPELAETMQPAPAAPAPMGPTPPSSEPAASVYTAPPPAISGWTPFSSYQRGDKPPTAMRFPDGTESTVRLWRHMVEQTASWLWSTGKLHRQNVPVKSRGTRHIVSLDAVHSDGRTFHSDHPVPNTPLRYEGNIGGPTPVDHAKSLLQHCNVDLETVLVMTGMPAPSGAAPITSASLAAADEALGAVEVGWVPLPGFNPPAGSNAPAAIRFPDSTESAIDSWRRLPRAVADWLYAKQLLTLETLPIVSGRRGFAANDKPVMRDGQPMTTYDTIGRGDIFINVHLSAVSARGNARKMLEHCGIDPATVHLQVAE